MFRLDGKIVLITGGSTHLGRAMSEGVCESGGKLITCSRNKERNIEYARQLNEQYSIDCIGVYLDFCDESSVDSLLDLVVSKFGKIDILINNAAFYVPDSIENQSYGEFMKGLDGTVGGTFNMTRKTLSIMIDQGYGNIINVASMYGAVSPDPSLYEGTGMPLNPSNYGCGKAAIIQLTKYIACNYAKYDIRANCIAPGPFPNPKIQKNLQFIENLKKKTPMNRIGEPDDLKGVTVFLASEASSYITGQCIHVDGGWTSW